MKPILKYSKLVILVIDHKSISLQTNQPLENTGNTNDNLS